PPVTARIPNCRSRFARWSIRCRRCDVARGPCEDAGMSRWSCVALLVIGCGHASPPPAPPHAPPDAGVAVAGPTALDDDLPRLADRAVVMMNEFAQAVTEAGEDCAVATAKINAVADKYADVIAANQKIYRAGHERVKQLREALAAHDEEMTAAAQKVMGAPAL